MSDTLLYAKASCDSNTEPRWTFDEEQQSEGAPHCVSNEEHPNLDPPVFIDPNNSLVLSTCADAGASALPPLPGTLVQLAPPFAENSVIEDVKTFAPNTYLPQMARPNNEMCPPEPTQNVILRVAVDGVGDGSSWTTPANLTAALLTAESEPTELWMQVGTYTSEVAVNRFTVPQGTRLYGGFQGGETLRSERNNVPDPINGTIVDGQASAENIARVFQVVTDGTPDNTIVFDGIVVRNGYSNLTGAAIFSSTNSDLVVRNCIIEDCESTTDGGGIRFNETGICTVTVCDTLMRNIVSPQFGGALTIVGGAEARLINSRFEQNSANIGGGCRIVNVDDFLAINCIWWNNSATDRGSAVSCQGIIARTTFLQCTFADNERRAVAYNGGNAQVDHRNCIFFNNGQDSDVERDIFVVNTTDVNVCDFICSDPTITPNSFAPAARFTFSGVQKLGVNPLFVDAASGDLRLTSASSARECGNNEALIDRDCSPSIVIPVGVTVSVDADLKPRLVGPVVDLGAYEFQRSVECFEEPVLPPATQVYRVQSDANGTGDGLDWGVGNAFTLEQALTAVDSATLPFELWIKKGTYASGGFPSKFLVPQGTRLYGGFAGNEVARAERDTNHPLDTIVEGSNDGRVFETKTHLTLSSLATSLTVFDSLSIQDADTFGNGGGVFHDDKGDITVRNCVIRNCNSNNGAGIASTVTGINNNNTMVLCKCVIESVNSNANGGGLLVANFKNLNISNCKFVSCFSGEHGGAVYVDACATVYCGNTEFLTNTSTGNGSALHITQVETQTSIVTQCTIVNNTSINGLGAVRTTSFTDLSVRNTIFFGNSDTDNSVVDISDEGSNTSVNVCNYMASKPDSFSDTVTSAISRGIGIDPRFVDIGNGDLRLLSDSPAIDSGNNGALVYRKCDNTSPHFVNMPIDLAQMPRVSNGTVDLGAYEFQQTCCICGVPDVQCNPLLNAMCPEESEQPLANVRYVTVTAQGNGSGDSWENSANIIDALAAINPFQITELWIAAGEYTVANLVVPFGAQLYGGFQGNETGRSQRNTTPGSNPLINTVFTTNGTDRGFQTTNGTGNSIVFDSVTLENMFSTNNGGAILCSASSMIIRNCLFRLCSTDTNGGAIFSNSGLNVNSSLTVCDCVFQENSASLSGGAIAVVATNVRIFNTMFAQNASLGGVNGSTGGAVSISGASDLLLLINCVFWDNVTDSPAFSRGGAVFLDQNQNSCFLQCTFVSNSCNAPNIALQESYGGACFVSDFGTTNFRNCIFSNNTVTGAVALDIASASGASVFVCDYIASDSDFESFQGVTIPAGQITLSGRKGNPTGSTNVQFVDQINGILQLTADSVARDCGNNDALVDCSCVEGDSMPVGVDVNVDLNRMPRIFDTTVDLGAYEYQTPKWRLVDGTKTLLNNNMCPELAEPNPENVIYVSVDGVGNGTSFSDPTNLGTALFTASAGPFPTEIWLLGGTYSVNGLSVPVGLRLYGGFQSYHTKRSQRNTDPLSTLATILDGTLSGRIFELSAGDTSEESTTIFDSLRFINGSTNASGPGAAILAQQETNLVLRNCAFFNNTSGGSIGGALFASSQTKSLKVCECLFDANFAESGGTMLIANVPVVCLFNNTIQNSTADTQGAVNVSGSNTNILIVNNIFCNNSVPLEPGSAQGVALYLGSVQKCLILQSTFFQNTAEVLPPPQPIQSFGTIYIQNCPVDISNCIFWQNSGTIGLDVFATGASSVVNVENYISTGTNAESFVQQNGATITLSGNQKQGNTPNEGDNDPRFVEPTACDLRLLKTSAAIDCGDSSLLQNVRCGDDTNDPTTLVDINVDRQRVDRIINEIVDLGAYEYVPNNISCSEVLLLWDGTDPQPCVHGDTLVVVENRGEIPIRDVRRGDRVLCVDRSKNGTETVFVEVTYNIRFVCCGAEFVRFEKGSLSENVPAKPLFIKDGHPIMTKVDGTESDCRDLTNGTTIKHVKDTNVKEIFSLATQSQMGDFALMQGGVPVKTWCAEGFDKYCKETEIGRKLCFAKL